MFKNIVGISWLRENLSNEDVRIVDCRFHLGEPKKGLEDYLNGHIQGAIYFDLNLDLSSPVSVHGGRHPLPNLDEFTDKLSVAGIQSTTTVVAYDDQGGPFASRLWWLLRYLGHGKVCVLDGGYSAWLNENLPISKDIPTMVAKTFEPNIQHSMVVNVDDMKERVEAKSSQIIDSREENRYLGLEEPIDKKAGHIPGAVNMFWKGVLNGNLMKEPQALKDHYSTLSQDEEIIVYCGSGVTACPNVLALEELDYKNVKLYVGSWSDWISYPTNPIVKK